MVRKRPIKPILSRALRDKKIIELYEEGYPVSEIVSRVHASPNTVTDRINQYNKSKEPPVISARAQAFALFKSNTSLVDVAAKLDLSADESQRKTLLMREEAEPGLSICRDAKVRLAEQTVLDVEGTVPDL